MWNHEIHVADACIRSHEDDRKEIHSTHLTDKGPMMIENYVQNDTDNSWFDNQDKFLITTNIETLVVTTSKESSLVPRSIREEKEEKMDRVVVYGALIPFSCIIFP